MDQIEEKVLLCYHCGNQTLMKVKAKGRASNFDNDGIGWTRLWRLYFCPVCNNVTLEEVYSFSEDFDYDGGPIYSTTILYPQTEESSLSAIPINIKNAFEAALKVQKIDGAICALSIRRTLEMMCKDKGQTSGELYNKLKNLSNNNVLPPILSDMGDILRTWGNEAAHGDDREFSPTEIDLMFEFTNTILDYVYVLPKKLELVQKRSVEIKAVMAEASVSGGGNITVTTESNI